MEDGERPEESDGRADRPVEIEELVRRHAGGLYRFAYRLTGRPDVAEDLVQDAFLDAMPKVHQLRSQDAAFAWLVSILRRRRVKWLKRAARAPIPLPPLELPAPASMPPEEFDEERLAEALERLPDEFREPVILFYFEDLKYREIADALETPIGTVMSRLARAKSMLRRMLDESETPPPNHEVRDGSL